MPEIIRLLARDRKYTFDVERVCFALALRRLCAPGSDLQGSSWLRTVECESFADIELRHF